MSGSIVSKFGSNSTRKECLRFSESGVLSVKKFEWALTAVLAGVVIFGILFVVLTVQKQSHTVEQVSVQEFNRYQEEYGLQGDAGGTIAAGILEMQAEEETVTNDSVLSAVSSVLPAEGKLVGVSHQNQELEIDYVLKEESAYTKRVVLTYDEAGLQRIDLRQNREMVSVSRDGKKEVTNME